jgi:putative SOS response-associated peptidase YedK
MDRYFLVQTQEKLEQRFNLDSNLNVVVEPSYNIAVGHYAAVITNEAPKKLQMFRWGIKAANNKKSKEFAFARTEGETRNLADNPNYSGGKGIIHDVTFRKAIRHNRCLVLADGYWLGSKEHGLEKPYLVYLRDKVRPFAFAGLWSKEVDENGLDDFSFAIITMPGNSLIHQLGHKRCPVILTGSKEKLWLNNNADLASITSVLKIPRVELMNAYPAKGDITNPDVNDKTVVEPVGQRIFEEFEGKRTDTWMEKGFGRRYQRESSPGLTMEQQVEFEKERSKDKKKPK